MNTDTGDNFKKETDRIESMVRVIVREIQQAEKDRQAELEEACDGIKYAEEQMAQGNRQPYMFLFEHFTENARKARRPMFKPSEAERLAATVAARLQAVDEAFLAEYKNGIAYLYNLFGIHNEWRANAGAAARKFFAGAEYVPDNAFLEDNTAELEAVKIAGLLHDALATEKNKENEK